MATCSTDNTGLANLITGPDACFPKIKNRWMFSIDSVCGTANTLPPFKSGRPSFDFKEQQIEHLVQPIYYPIKVDWKPVQITLYDMIKNQNPVFTWMQQVYDPNGSTEWQPVYNGSNQTFKRDCALCLYDGCNTITESWTFKNAYPQAINWGELTMNEVAIVTIELTLRYDRAYINTGGGGGGSGGGSPSPYTGGSQNQPYPTNE